MTLTNGIVIGYWSGNLSKQYSEITLFVLGKTNKITNCSTNLQRQQTAPSTKYRPINQIKPRDIVDIFHFNGYALRINIGTVNVTIIHCKIIFTFYINV